MLHLLHNCFSSAFHSPLPLYCRQDLHRYSISQKRSNFIRQVPFLYEYFLTYNKDEKKKNSYYNLCAYCNGRILQIIFLNLFQGRESSQLHIRCMISFVCKCELIYMKYGSHDKSDLHFNFQLCTLNIVEMNQLTKAQLCFKAQFM